MIKGGICATGEGGAAAVIEVRGKIKNGGCIFALNFGFEGDEGALD